MTQNHNHHDKPCCASKNKSQTEHHAPQQAASKENTAPSSCCDSKQQPQKKSIETTCNSSVTVKSNLSSCCAPADTQQENTSSCCPTDNKGKARFDWMLWLSSAFVALMYVLYLFMPHSQEHAASSLPDWLTIMSHTSFEMANAMWWGVLLGVILVGWLNRIPREVVIKVLGKGHTKTGIFRATLAGLLLDLCNHGILMVAMKLYERGASLGQVMAFLIASPWNSFTLTLILIGLIGLPWTLAFIVFSMVIAWISGYVFDRLEMSGKVAKNPYFIDQLSDTSLADELKTLYKQGDYSLSATMNMLWHGLKGSAMVIRWVMFGVVLVAFVRAFVPETIFSDWFGASVIGLLLTLLAATIIEVCSEGSTPIAADLVNRASAPGNGFTFLMAGASTDYTEVMAIKDTMKSWKIALLLPLITVPQILFIGFLMNYLSA